MAMLTYIFITILIALGAFNSQNNLLFWAFGFSLSLLGVSGVLSGAMLMGIDVQRVAVDQASEGESASITYRVRNRNRFVPAFALTIEEVHPPSGWFERWFGGRDRREHPANVQKGTDRLSRARAFVAHVGARQSVTARADVIAVRRGPATLRGMLVSTSYPFGIIRKSLLFEEAAEIIIHPRRVPVDPALIRESVRLGERGNAPTRRAGPGSEFFALRDYRGGDGIRAIAWRPSARRGELLVRQPAAPAPVRLIVALDLDPDADAAMTEQTISLAASLIDAACERRLDVGLTVPASAIAVRPREGRLQHQRMLDELACLDASEAARNAGFNHTSAARSAIVVIHSGARAPWTDSVHGALHVRAEGNGGGTT